jgi:hypothetical protein
MRSRSSLTNAETSFFDARRSGRVWRTSTPSNAPGVRPDDASYGNVIVPDRSSS